jgi:hypothetical protein
MDENLLTFGRFGHTLTRLFASIYFRVCSWFAALAFDIDKIEKEMADPSTVDRRVQAG